MDINLITTLIQFLTILITIISVTILYKTLTNSKILNQNVIFNEVVKQERELRIKLAEYREEIAKKMEDKKYPNDWKDLVLDYDTLLFNYYEYLALVIRQNLVNRKLAKIYFKQLLSFVKDNFDDSILFEEDFANRKHYPGLQWIFKFWNI